MTETPPRARSGEATLSGGLLVDKPIGPTSHDVVARIRRKLGVRRVGHAGTLDPMASGLLVVLVGEATKLAPYLTSESKRYRARIVLGTSTTTLDADGEVTARAALPDALVAELAGGAAMPLVDAALDAERRRTEQVPPAHSAIKVAGARSYTLARQGAPVALPPRPVHVDELRIVGAGMEMAAGYIDAELLVTKGYYVRSFAQDVGMRLAVPAHLGALRRMASGAFHLDAAVALDAPRDALVRALIALPALATKSLPAATLCAHAVARARAGQRLASTDFADAPPAGLAAWLDPAGELVAIGARDEPSGSFRVERGFAPQLPSAPHGR